MGDGIISRRGLGNSSDLTNYYDKTETDNLLSGKVDKVEGKQLSDENYTAVEKAKLANISEITNYAAGRWEPYFAYYQEKYVPIPHWVKISTHANYSRRWGGYVLIGDLCFVNFSLTGTFTSRDHVGEKIGIGPLPFASNQNDYWQALTLSACVRKSSDDGTQLWTPTAGIVGRIETNSNYFAVHQQNGYITCSWPDDISNPYYIEGSGTYKIQRSSLSDTPIDTSGSSAEESTP